MIIPQKSGGWLTGNGRKKPLSSILWQEKATIQHSRYVTNASFSPDGTHLVTASNDHTAKIWGLIDGQWQEKATVQHSDGVIHASFSPGGAHLVTASYDCTAKVSGLVDGQWKEKT
ncbi:WD40 repeat domain-containing protein, partial [Sansalvadorimonas verongulae]|uniref:WD40 repeat domain-containing protein n=1 Tax=Sansalvadorimonas verongulae TaxID=2172824 RepID=UPI001E3233A1